MAEILLVDDNPKDCEILTTTLRQEGHRVRTVPNGREALSAVLADEPDLVVLDVFMPEMDGVTFLEILRSYLRYQDLPVLVMTAHPDSPAVVRARELVVRDVIIKDSRFYFVALAAVRDALAATATGRGDASSGAG